MSKKDYITGRMDGLKMSKKDYITGRMDGLKLALRIADRDGIDGIRKEIAYRNNGGINTRLSMRELDEASQEIKENCVDTIMIMAMWALRDEFGRSGMSSGLGKTGCSASMTGSC